MAPKPSEAEASTVNRQSASSSSTGSPVGEDAYTIPPGSATGMPDGFDSDPDTPIINLDSRLIISVAESDRPPDPPSGLPEHLGEQDHFPKRPVVYLLPRLRQDDGLELTAPDSLNKGKQKQSEPIRDQDVHGGEMDTGSLEQHPIGVIPGFPVRMQNMPSESKEAITRAVNEAIRDLELKLSDHSTLSEKSQNVSEHATQRSQELIGGLSDPVISHWQSAGQKFLDWLKPGDAQRTAAARTMTMTMEALQSLAWRMEVMEKRQQIIHMQYVYRRGNAMPLQMDYGTGIFDMWTQDDATEMPKDDKKGYKSNRKRLLRTLRAFSTDERFPSIILHDYTWAKGSRDSKRESHRPWAPGLANAIMQLHTVSTFSNTWDASGGLLIMGCNIHTYDEMSNDLTNVVPFIINHYENATGCWVITHFAGRRTSEKNNQFRHEPYAGVSGLLRSMCHQLAGTVHRDLQVLSTWCPDDLEQVYQGDISMLCRLFRGLLLEVAAHGNREQGEYSRTVVLVIDSIHVLEWTQYIEDFFLLVDFLRAICEEAMIGDLGSVLNFKYYFLHNGMSALIQKPHPREHVVFYETWRAQLDWLAGRKAK